MFIWKVLSILKINPSNFIPYYIPSILKLFSMPSYTIYNKLYRNIHTLILNQSQSIYIYNVRIYTNKY